jgi:hypothetical protein
MAEASGKVQTWRPNMPQGQKSAEALYGGHDAATGKPQEAKDDINPSDPANTGTTPGSNAKVG